MHRLLIIFLSCLLTAGVFAHSGENHRNIGDRASNLKEKGKVVHKDLSVMRKMHPEFLYHKRDKTLRQGIRTKRNSLKLCVNCHSSTDNNGEFVPIDQKDQFCSTCHQKVGVSLDCFSCHRNTPKEDLQ
jgi:hypothetical protein